MSSANWWARKLGTPEQPVARLDTVHPGYQTPAPVQEPSVPAASFRKPPSHERASGVCPACNSDKYFKAVGMPNPRCFECGYPVEHTTSGMSSVQGADGGAATPSRQNDAGVGNFNPQGIIGRVG